MNERKNVKEKTASSVADPIQTEEYEISCPHIKTEIKSEQEELLGKCERFLCPKCSKHFFTEDDFVKHVINEHHSKEKDSACHKNKAAQCSSDSRLPSASHNIIKNTRVSRILSVSNVFVGKPDDLLLKGHNSAARNICNTCEYSSYDKYKLESHKRRWHHLDNPFKCEQCDYAGKSQGNLDNHKRYCHVKKRFKCSQCDYESSRKWYLATHLLTKHSSSTPYRCDLCPFVTNTAQNIKVHMRSRHSSDKPYKCKSCNYSTISSTKLNIHNRVHTGVRPYKCDSCSYAANTRMNLTVHTRIHTGEKPLKCPHCEEYTTGDPCNFRCHIRRRHGKSIKLKGFNIVLSSTS